MPVVDEVTLLEKVPEGVLAAVEVAAAGQVVRVLSNPYGIATFCPDAGGNANHRPYRQSADWQPFRRGAENAAG